MVAPLLLALQGLVCGEGVGCSQSKAHRASSNLAAKRITHCTFTYTMYHVTGHFCGHEFCGWVHPRKLNSRNLLYKCQICDNSIREKSRNTSNCKTTKNFNHENFQSYGMIHVLVYVYVSCKSQCTNALIMYNYIVAIVCNYTSSIYTSAGKSCILLPETSRKESLRHFPILWKESMNQYFCWCRTRFVYCCYYIYPWQVFKSVFL